MIRLTRVADDMAILVNPAHVACVQPSPFDQGGRLIRFGNGNEIEVRESLDEVQALLSSSAPAGEATP